MYHFPLSAVLTHRKYIEDNLQKELGILKRVLVHERKKLDDIFDAKKRFAAELQEKQKHVITASENILYLGYLDRLVHDLNHQKTRVSNAEKDIEQKRDALIEAMKRRKSLEKLKEKGLQAHRQKSLRKEQSFMNEMASVRHKIKF